jgi:hypothetical protein
VPTGGVMVTTECVTDEHGITAIGIEAAVGLDKKLVGVNGFAAVKKKRLIEVLVKGYYQANTGVVVH